MYIKRAVIPSALWILSVLLLTKLSHQFITKRIPSTIFGKRNDLSLPAKKQTKVQSSPEFSRILNAGKIPARRPVLCKILAKDFELDGLTKRLDTFRLEYFAANVTIQRESSFGILVKGEFEAFIKDDEFLESERVCSDFDTLLLDTTAVDAISFEDATEFDDEVPSNGDIDIGEIVTQYLQMELF